MTAIVLLGLLIAVLIGLAFTFGGAALAVLLAIAAVLAVGWFALVGLSRRTPTPREVTERADEREFLGPGGPDDPRA